MRKIQFDIRSLLLVTVVAGCLLNFFTLGGSILFRFFVTLTISTFLASVIALVWLVAIPLFGKD